MNEHHETSTSNHARQERDHDRRALIAAIDDPLVRRVVGLSLHVRGYLPYYAVTVALFGFLAFGPRHSVEVAPVASSGGVPAPGVSVGGATGDGGPATSGVAGSRAAGPAAVALDGTLSGSDLSSTAGALEVGDLGGGSLTDQSGSAALPVPPAPAAPGLDDPGFGFGSDVPGDFETPEPVATCTVTLPSPAPSISPSREVGGLQQTAEAVAGVSAPVDGSGTAEEAASTIGCPSVGATPDVPVPVGLPI